MHFGPEQLAALRAADRSFTRFNARRTLRRQPPHLETRRFGEVVVAFRDPVAADPYYNRVVGLDGDSLGLLEELLPWYQQVGRTCRVELHPQAAVPEVLAHLADRGFALVDTSCLLAMRATDIGPPSARVPVRRAQRQDLDAVFDLWELDGEPISAELRQARADAQLAPEFPIHLALLEGRPAAMATTYRSHGFAWLSNAITAPDHRRQGCHIALLEHRLWDCRRSGCRWAITDTTFGSVSHRNAERAGMRVAFLRLGLEQRGA